MSRERGTLRTGYRFPRGTGGFLLAALLLGPVLPGHISGPSHLEARQGSPPPASLQVTQVVRPAEVDPPGVAGARAAGPGVPDWTVFQAAELPVSPRGAFLRSLVLPGWGHLSVDAPGRAAFYVAAQSGTAWMLGKSILRRSSARRFRDEEYRTVWEELQARGIQSPDSLRTRALGDARVERWQELVDIRGDQVEDWLALGIFLSLLGATDALVAAHMADYPEPLAFDVMPRGGADGWELRFRLPLGRAVAPGY